MNVPILAAVALIVLVALMQLAFSNQFAGRIDILRSTAAAEQEARPTEKDAPPEIIRLFALRNGAKMGGPLTVLASQLVEMRLGPDQGFFPIAATQLSGTRRPSFVWDAWGTMAGFAPIHVVDSYVEGAGLLEVRLAGSLRLAHGAGPESDKGEVMRFLSELAWNPDAILNASGLGWRQIDERTVEVSATTTNGIASVRQLFDSAGDIIGIEADDRPFGAEGSSVPTRWIGRFRDYTQFGDYRLPRHGEVAWVLPAGEFVYWRGQITKFVPQ